MIEIKAPSFMSGWEWKKNHSWIVTMFLFSLIYIVGIIIVNIVSLPGMAYYLLAETDYLSMISSGAIDMEKMTAISSPSNYPQWLIIFMLYLELALLVTFLLYGKIFQKRTMSSFGFVKKGGLKFYGIGLVLGGAAFSLVYILCVITGTITWNGFAKDFFLGYFILYFGGYMVQSMAEEVICRGFLMVTLCKKYGGVTSIIMSGIVFGLMHINNSHYTFLAFVNIILFGIFAGMLMIYTNNIWVVAAFHCVWNFFQGNVFGIQVSGLPKQNAVFSTTTASGYSWVNGGAFGLEGGIMVTLVMCMSIGFVGYALWKKGELIIENIALKTDNTNQELKQEQEENHQGIVNWKQWDKQGKLNISKNLGGKKEEEVLKEEELPSEEELLSKLDNTTYGDVISKEDKDTYRINPDVTQTPWHPDTAKALAEGAKSRDSYEVPVELTVKTEFDASYFSQKEE